MESTFMRGYHVKHRHKFKFMLDQAQKIADYAVKHKNNKKMLSSKNVKHFGLPSTISNQILRKYGRGTIKQATNVHLIVPNSCERTYTNKNGETKVYRNIEYSNSIVYIKPLKLRFRWNPGRDFVKINQIEISSDRYMITATFNVTPIEQVYSNVLGVDLNCGIGRSIANCANLKNGEILNIGKQGPNIRKYYFQKRQAHKVKGHKEKRRMRDLDHKISRTIVNYALKHKLTIILEDLKGIRSKHKKGKGSKKVNRFVNSWSFYRLRTFIEYKSKEHGIPLTKINPQYTSQLCSYCMINGYRHKEIFICKNKHCHSFNKERHSDRNAAFNIGLRSLQPGGSAQ